MERDRIIPTEKSLSKKESIIKKEKFIYEYCKMKNWNSSELTSQQMIEIVQNFKYQNKGL
jgi:hypothetical protein